MRRQNLGIAVICTALLAPSAFPAQQVITTPVTIRVSDQLGAVIAHAQIRLVPSPDNAPAKLETDDQGRFSIRLEVGGYALFVSAQGFKTGAQHIDIAAPQAAGNTGQVVNVVLRIADSGSPTAAYSKDSLVLTDDLYHIPVELSPADFRALPHIAITVHNSHTKADETYSGVPLATLLAKLNAPVGDGFRKEALTTYLIASGSDGYSVVLSLAEVDPNFRDGPVLVADTRDGQPLAKSGPFELIVPGDKRPARWVHNLNFIGLEHR